MGWLLTIKCWTRFIETDCASLKSPESQSVGSGEKAVNSWTDWNAYALKYLIPTLYGILNGVPTETW
jgi:hypothetical protein